MRAMVAEAASTSTQIMNVSPVVNDMNERWDGFATELRSSDPDRVNDVVDEIKGMDLDERVELFDVCFDGLTEIYAESDDGYVRQSVVRVAERLVPEYPVVMAAADDDRSLGKDIEEVRVQTDRLCGFLLEAKEDAEFFMQSSLERILDGL